MQSAACENRNRIWIPKMHEDVIKWKHFPCYWPFVLEIHWSPVNSPHKGQWRGALVLSLICTCINGWLNNREADHLRHHRAHYDGPVMDRVYFVMCFDIRSIFFPNRLCKVHVRPVYILLLIIIQNSYCGVLWWIIRVTAQCHFFYLQQDRRQYDFPYCSLFCGLCIYEGNHHLKYGTWNVSVYFCLIMLTARSGFV